MSLTGVCSWHCKHCPLLPSARMHSEGMASWSVCLSVTQHLTSPMFFRLTNDTTYLTGNEAQKFCGDFPETTAFERYAVKTSEKANCLISLGLPRPDLLALCTLGAQVKSCGVIRAEPKLG